MTLEKFNLHITTPEGEEKDPELIRLRAELMALKPLLDDAIKSKSLKEAEELYAKAVEAKAKLEAYKESLNKKEQYPTIEINGVQVEFGPELGEMTFDEIPTKLEEFNKTLKPGEKPWRVPAKEEFEEIGKPIREIWNDVSLTNEQKTAKAKELVESLGFAWDSLYWSDSEGLDSIDYAWLWYTYGGEVDSYYVRGKILVRLVR